MQINLLRLKNVPILEQLKLEEALLRANDENWCIVNHGSEPAIVMGISGKIDELVHADKADALSIPLIKRYSGGGTVVVDEETVFVSWIGNHELLEGPCFPEPLMRWTTPFFANTPIELRQNDYVIGEHKVGGNAQYIRKNRFCHHTSFLYDYQSDRMACLKEPKRRPDYRQDRDHEAFVTRLNQHFASKEALIDEIVAGLKSKFAVVEAERPNISGPYRIATALVQRS